MAGIKTILMWTFILACKKRHGKRDVHFSSSDVNLNQAQSIPKAKAFIIPIQRT
jgi:hypothetical protein